MNSGRYSEVLVEFNCVKIIAGKTEDFKEYGLGSYRKPALNSETYVGASKIRNCLFHYSKYEDTVFAIFGDNTRKSDSGSNIS